MRLVGVGLESIGVEEFIEGKFFDGGEEFVNLIEFFPDSINIFHSHLAELFVDNDKQSYKEMGFQRFSFLSLFSLFRSKKWTDAGAMVSNISHRIVV